MTPLKLRPDLLPVPSGRPGFNALGARERAVLNHVRLHALKCRSASRTDLFQACAVLSTSRSVAKAAYAETLMKCLSQTLKTAPVFFRPNVEEISFDEAWLLQAISVAGRQDWDSFAFLLQSRVPQGSRRNLGFLIINISDQFL